MKFLVLSACVAAAAAQGFYGLQSFPNGAVVPVDAAPAVAYTGYNAAPVAYAGYSGYAPTYGYAGPLNLNTQLIAHPNGAVVPVDEPAVAAARADHLAVK